MPVRSLSARVVEVVSETREVEMLRHAFEELSPIEYLPGQSLQISIPVSDGPPTRRFSISSSPTE